ncbi:TadE family type IV pilus minor pilin [Streptomyces sp. NPDC101166]|uniref:TadE family type IV pilus minor pilin n=1 Tax=Streptomyces sp. NPDC101166 TaxID=3366120 RepID=UPI00380FBFCE
MTAESAVVLPVLVAFAMALVWGLLVMAAQIQCVDAARAGARAAARQDPEGAVVAMAREIAPGGARVTVSREGDRVRVTVAAEPPVLRGLPFEVREEAVAAAEDAGTGSVAETRAAAAGRGAEAGGSGPGQGVRQEKAGSGVRSGIEPEPGADGEEEP